MRPISVFPVLLGALAALGLGAEPALVQRPAVAEHRASPLALVASLGVYEGAAVGAELRLGPVGVRATGGGNLTMLSVRDAGDDEIDSFHIFATGQGNADVYAFPLHLSGGLEFGLSAGARYNTLLGVGYGGALEARRQLRDRLGLRVALGVTFFPDGDDRVVEKEDFREDSEFNAPFGAGLQTGAQVALTFDLL